MYIFCTENWLCNGSDVVVGLSTWRSGLDTKPFHEICDGQTGAGKHFAPSIGSPSQYFSVVVAYSHLTLRLLMSYIYGATSKARNANVVYRVSQEECEILRESVPYVKLYRYNPKHLYPKLNGYGDNGQRSLKL